MPKGNLRNIRVDQPRWDLALRVAAREGTSISAVLSLALDRFLKKHATTEELAELTADQSTSTASVA
jgi:hypothetical protein